MMVFTIDIFAKIPSQKFIIIRFWDSMRQHTPILVKIQNPNIFAQQMDRETILTQDSEVLFLKRC